MADKVAGRDLIGRNVVSDRGTIIGMLSDISVETTGGKVTMLIVKPGKDIDVKRFRLSDNGELLIPFKAVKAVKDVLIVNESGIPFS
ncbi:MAG TPA: PRC-barrel domain containing protein [Euryarchaeota archaeon]|nr:PRC-barrel domain protein [archaeon BMS3Bbin15]HDL15229.1 PRC-barrel domain containing protein [Euryarchaeota archaeon]